jgi:hypothetical protein
MRWLKISQDPSEIGPKWFVKQALNHTSEQHRDSWEPIWLRAFLCLKSFHE